MAVREVTLFKLNCCVATERLVSVELSVAHVIEEEAKRAPLNQKGLAKHEMGRKLHKIDIAAVKIAHRRNERRL